MMLVVLVHNVKRSDLLYAKYIGMFKFCITANNSISHYIHISLLDSYHINKRVVMISGRQVQICRATVGNLGKLKTITFFKAKPSSFEHYFIKHYSDINVTQCKIYFWKIICFIKDPIFNCKVIFVFWWSAVNLYCELSLCKLANLEKTFSNIWVLLHLKQKIPW